MPSATVPQPTEMAQTPLPAGLTTEQYLKLQGELSTLLHYCFFNGLIMSLISNNRRCLCCGFWHRRLGLVRLPISVSPSIVCAHVSRQVWYSSPMRYLSISPRIKVSGELRRHGCT